MVILCGSCADILSRENLVSFVDGMTEISPGAVCELHPTTVPFAAVVAVVLNTGTESNAAFMALRKDAIGRGLKNLQLLPGEQPPLPPPWQPLVGAPALVGIQTKIATRLLCAWTAEDRFADEAMIDNAINVAALLLSKTKGA